MSIKRYEVVFLIREILGIEILYAFIYPEAER